MTTTPSTDIAISRRSLYAIAILFFAEHVLIAKLYGGLSTQHTLALASYLVLWFAGLFGMHVYVWRLVGWSKMIYVTTALGCLPFVLGKPDIDERLKVMVWFGVALRVSNWLIVHLHPGKPRTSTIGTTGLDPSAQAIKSKAEDAVVGAASAEEEATAVGESSSLPGTRPGVGL